MEHIEEAGIHSGDSACAIPPFSLSAETVAELKQQTYALAEALNVRGLMNIQFAVKDGEIYVLEVNPRASRTVPFVSKATGLNLAQAAARVMVGRVAGGAGDHRRAGAELRLGEGGGLPVRQVPGRRHRARPRDAVDRRGDGDRHATSPRRSPRARSPRTAGCPTSGTVFVSVAARDRKAIVPIAARLAAMGYDLMGTGGTAAALGRARDRRRRRSARSTRAGPNLLDHLANGAIALIVNTPSGKGARTDEGRIRASAVSHGVPCITTIAGARAAVAALERLRQGSSMSMRCKTCCRPRRGQGRDGRVRLRRRAGTGAVPQRQFSAPEGGHRARRRAMRYAYAGE